MVDSSISVSSCTDLAWALAAKGSDLCKIKKYEDGIKLQKAALDFAAYSNNSDADSDTSTLSMAIRYEIAAALYDQDKYAEASKQLQKVKLLNPNYYEGRIQDFAKDVEKMKYYDLGSKYFNEASHAFDEELWNTAIQKYADALKMFELAGSNENALSCKYNIGLCYFNHGLYEEAKQQFEEIRLKNPDYSKEKIDELFSKINRFLK